MKYAFLLFSLFLPPALFGASDPYTRYTEDHFYITTGEIDFQLNIEDVGTTLLKYNDYSKWAFQGMQGVDQESEGLIAYFTDVRYSAEQNLFYVTFDLNLIWPFGKKGNEIKFQPVQKFDNDGNLRGITLIPMLGKRLVYSAILNFKLRETSWGSSLSYSSKIRLTPFLDFFFSLRSYRKNFEWYVFKLTDNLKVYLEDLYD